MAPQVGLEPTTLRLTAGCSAIELLRSVLGRARRAGPSVVIHNIICWAFRVLSHFGKSLYLLGWELAPACIASERCSWQEVVFCSGFFLCLVSF